MIKHFLILSTLLLLGCNKTIEKKKINAPVNKEKQTFLKSAYFDEERIKNDKHDVKYNGNWSSYSELELYYSYNKSKKHELIPYSLIMVEKHKNYDYCDNVFSNLLEFYSEIELSDFYNGGFRIAKGFLKLSEIVKFKVYDNIEDSEFQRKADISHVNFLIDYLNTKPYKILPDIIFSMKTDYPNSSLIEEKRYLINDKTIWNLEIMEPRYNAQKENGLKTITIWIQDNAYDFIDTIDGNHRLKALQKIYNEKLDSSPNLEDYKIPVTFILNNTKNKEKAFFYYLNSFIVLLSLA